MCVLPFCSAPEIFHSFLSGGTGYSFEVDWWSLGIMAYELLRGWVGLRPARPADVCPGWPRGTGHASPLCSCPQRPYDIHSSNPVESLVQLFSTVSVQYSSAWSKEMVALLRKVRGPSGLELDELLEELSFWAGFGLDGSCCAGLAGKLSAY